MNDLDKRIQEALRKEDAELLRDFVEQPSLFEQVTETFRGRGRWLAFVGVFWGIVFTVVWIWAAVRFFYAETTRDIVMWAAICMMCIAAVWGIKAWYFMGLNKNAVTREIKRLELQIARLASRLKE